MATHRNRHAADSRARARAFTLAEAVVSVAVMSVLAGGLASAMLIAAKAIPDPDDPFTQQQSANYSLEQIAGELYCAKTVPYRSDRAIEFTVADRDNNGSDELIRYEWSGTAGDPVLRTYNGGTALPALDAVDSFLLNYSYDVEAQAAVSTESNEQLLISHDSSGGTLNTLSVSGNSQPGQYFLPSFADEVTAWSIKRVKFVLQQNVLPTETLGVCVKKASTGGTPSSTILEDVQVAELSLPLTLAWYEVQFSTLSGLDPSQGMCVVLYRAGGSQTAARVQYEINGTDTPNSMGFGSSDGGGSWNTPNGTELLYYVYGTITSDVVPDPKYYLAHVIIEADPASEGTGSVETAVSLLNRPEVAAP